MNSGLPPGPRSRNSLLPQPTSPSSAPSSTPMTHAEVGRRMTPQGAQEYFLRVVPSLERDIGELRKRLEEQTERNENLSHAMGLLTAQLLGAYAEIERLRDLHSRDRASHEELRASLIPGGGTDRIYRLFRALIDLSPQEVTEYLVHRKEVHAILTGLRSVLGVDGGRGDRRSG
ncbi:MAG: hypothetical protein R3A48_03185 [Polyangiales bacterium]